MQVCNIKTIVLKTYCVLSYVCYALYTLLPSKLQKRNN